jgi:hypothetical protein
MPLFKVTDLEVPVMSVWELEALVLRLVIFKSYVSALVAALHWKVTWPAVFTSWQGALLAGAVRADLPGASITGAGGGVGVSSPPAEEQEVKAISVKARVAISRLGILFVFMALSLYSLMIFSVVLTVSPESISTYTPVGS